MCTIAKSATPAILALLLQALAALADEAGDPPVIDGCGIWPHTQCRGADLRHAKLAGRNLAGADFSGARMARADLTGATRAQQVRWLSLVAAAALPYGIRRSLLARRSRARAGSQTPSGEGD